MILSICRDGMAVRWSAATFVRIVLVMVLAHATALAARAGAGYGDPTAEQIIEEQKQEERMVSHMRDRANDLLDDILPMGTHQPPPPQPAVPEGARVRIELDREAEAGTPEGPGGVQEPEFLLGQNVLVHVIVENAGTTPFTINTYSSGGQLGRFNVTLWDTERASPSIKVRSSLTWTPEIAFRTDSSGPLPVVNKASTVRPGEKMTFSFPLMQYCEIVHPGRYEMAVSHDFGWTGSLPVARAAIHFRTPTREEADAVFDAAAKLEAAGLTTLVSGDGAKSAPFADFTAMRYPEYLDRLAAHFLAGHAAALPGIEATASPKATEILLALAADEKWRFDIVVAQALCERLPVLPGPGDPDLGKDVVHRLVKQRLMAKSWDPALAESIRATARRWIEQLPPRQAAAVATTPIGLHPMTPSLDQIAAEVIRRVGVAEDAATLHIAMGRALAAPIADLHLGIWTGQYGEPLNTEILALRALYARGYKPVSAEGRHAAITAPGQAMDFFLFFDKEEGRIFPGNMLDDGDNLTAQETRDKYRFAATDYRSRRLPEDWTGVLQAFQDSPYPALRMAIARALPEPPPAECAPFLQAGMNSKNAGIRYDACRAAGRVRHKESLPALLKIMANDPDSTVAGAASAAATRMGARYETMLIWCDRLTTEHSEGWVFGFHIGFNHLESLLSNRPSMRTDGHLGTSEMKAIQAAWRHFLTAHEAAIRAGQQIPFGTASATPNLFPANYRFNLNPGSDTRWMTYDEVRALPKQ